MFVSEKAGFLNAGRLILRYEVAVCVAVRYNSRLAVMFMLMCVWSYLTLFNFQSEQCQRICFTLL